MRSSDRADIRNFLDFRGGRGAQYIEPAEMLGQWLPRSPHRRRGFRGEKRNRASVVSAALELPLATFAADFSPMRSSSASLATPRR